MSKDAWATQKKELKSRDAKTFVYAANHLLLQGRPPLTALVRGVEKRLVGIAADRKAKSELRLDALKALGTLASDASRLAPLLEREESPAFLMAVAIAIAGPDNRVASERATTQLIEAFEKAKDWGAQYDAIVALRHFDGDDRIDAVLRKALTHVQGPVVREAIVALGHHRNLHVVAELIEFLGSKDPQLVGAAAQALWRIHLPVALAPLADKKRYAHARKLAKDPVSGRFGVRALAWFDVPTVDDDLLKLATSKDGEVAEAACAGLLHRRALGALAPLAKHVFTKTTDASYYGRFFLSLVLDLAAMTPKPPARVVGELAAVLGVVKAEQYEELLSGNKQLRYQLDRIDEEAQRNVATWREALGKKIRDKTIRSLVVRMMASPREDV